MNTLPTSPLSSAIPSFSLPKDAPGAARTALKLLLRLKHGTLTVCLPGGSVQRFGSGHAPMASLHLHNWNPCSAALRSGDIGFAESYIAGDWTTPHLSDLLQVLIANRNEVEDVIYGSWLGRLVYRVKHLLNRNTKVNSQKNIHAHYDLGNAFYELWLDGTMNYSSAIFETPQTSMQDAQNAKVRRALNMARVKPGDRVLEIGCGWGALAEMATTEFDASLVGVTLSTEQLAWAQARMARRGVPCKGQGNEHDAAACDLRLQDYRDIGKTSADEPFDAICSIEMVEAVGREYWPEYFQTVARLLKPGGHACIQSIVIADELFDRYVSSTDFIQQYIFPGGCLPCPREFRAQAAAAGFDVVDEFAFGQDYARTLQLWREGFMAQESRVLQLGFDKRFIRIWEFYLAYCEAAFAEANTNVMQFTLRKR
ncbi:MAG: SAM-dependent methyltransferase [Polaromonas sp. 39-63-203]|jgi:cyclopropane-fatty-acyl-phospholipid synthase|uniref:SAM-dependent methyltransferase n=1 Tax=Polaromonas sp. TaxID=1869339 RepID=UPI000BDBB283|nr:cyclopropane-fatty-acyl-phospholipid synthase family protein [Polaromonas sp.]OYY49665.1 MAG: SAM-dependent methyltransferase [Polaromonas sp. 35-63-240]OYY96439.1 MAG: SAM-dependent methyltransferase [Polaromonas sp. 28-63-22]OYZ84239.1 MAG: SAM-dependent methyltransferase [Polaromonas sp. 24-62-144]OZA99514.1 MAG: SAM-dependent methyltransferase [Polaromonas sp. 39-63-203]HQS32840.1 cyclopropane-fatty-acyl-phospholipid synthase family protein [Polaromonas sp.]